MQWQLSNDEFNLVIGYHFHKTVRLKARNKDWNILTKAKDFTPEAKTKAKDTVV